MTIGQLVIAILLAAWAIWTIIESEKEDKRKEADRDWWHLQDDTPHEHKEDQ